MARLGGGRGVDALNEKLENVRSWSWSLLTSPSFGAVLMVECPNGHKTVVNRDAYTMDEPETLSPVVRAMLLSPSFICSHAPACQHHAHLRLVERNPVEQPSAGAP